MNKYSIEKTPRDVRFDMAEKHKKLGKQKGFSQVELAERSGVSLGSLKRFENKRQISLESLLKLVCVLPSYLILKSCWSQKKIVNTSKNYLTQNRKVNGNCFPDIN